MSQTSTLCLFYPSSGLAWEWPSTGQHLPNLSLVPLQGTYVWSMEATDVRGV